LSLNTKVLVFGLGYDSKMWYEGNNRNTFFIEDNNQYIELNKNDISLNNIIHYNYNTTVEYSFKITDDKIKNFEIPNQLLLESPFDIIIIDGPQWYTKDKPGRLIPCYWSTILSKPGSLIYIDDSKRDLETFCIKKYFDNKVKEIFRQRGNCTKIFV
jgi:hypothetical protein